MNEERPWGHYEKVAYANDFWIKTVYVNPMSRLSLQFHQNRDEHWYIIRGECYIYKGMKVKRYKEGDFIDIPAKQVHRIENHTKEPLLFCEIATGKPDEADIERIQDDYERDLPF